MCTSQYSDCKVRLTYPKHTSRPVQLNASFFVDRDSYLATVGEGHSSFKISDRICSDQEPDEAGARVELNQWRIII